MIRKTKPTPERPRPSRPRKVTVLPEARAEKASGALRRAAEARPRGRPAIRQPGSEADLRRLQHALEVHRIKLETQNAQLRQAQSELQTALEHYAELYDFAPLGYLVLKPDSTIVQANLTAASLLGIERARMLKRRFAAFTVAGARSAFNAFLTRTFVSKAPEVHEVRLSIKGMQPVTVQLRIAVSEDGQEGRVVMTDISQRILAEEALRESEHRYRAVVEDQTEVIDRFLADGTIIFANDVYCRFFGKSRQELIGQKWQPRAFPADLPQIEEKLRTIAPSNPVVVIENRVYSGDGQVHWMQFVNRAFFDAQGRLKEIQAVGRDITERKQAEELVHQISGRLLQLQDEERRRLARELHDTLTQSLAVLSINLNLLQGAVPSLDVGSKQLLADSLTLAEQCTKQIRTSSYLLYPPMLDELGLAEAMRDHADGFARRTGLRVHLELPPDLDRLPRETELALFRVLQEALANIHRHSGSKTASIRVPQTADEIRLEVRDKGHGIVPPSPPGAVSGTVALGVGIAGMGERMRQLGGRLEIQSDDRGTTVIAILPRQQAMSRL